MDDKEKIPDWSKIDATTIYRSGGASPLEESTEEKSPQDIKRLSKDTNIFLIIFITLMIVVIAIVIVSTF